ncbi:hypothetical protein WSM22_20510 [Cytophagales bacterium WSM2-2]|nr:hypothetical protein WSM22_20510 [Cytophagales bacterium WSM2-2]
MTNKIEGDLPAHQFVRVHKSYIVNRDKIERIDGDALHVSGNRIPVSPNTQENVIDKIVNGRL